MKLSKLAAVAFLLLTSSASSQTVDELKNDGRNTENVINLWHWLFTAAI
jgi:hypothetical protein